MSTDRQAVDYRTHILIGVRAGGVMTVLADWPYVPLQAEVQKEIDCTRSPYVTFALCTPTSIIPAGAGGDAASDRSFRFDQRS